LAVAAVGLTAGCVLPTVEADLTVRVVPPGGADQVEFWCTNAPGSTATVVINTPDQTYTLTQTTPSTYAGWYERFGPGTPYPTTTPGQYTVAASCPGYAAGSASFVVAQPTLPATAFGSALSANCAPKSSDPALFRVGETVSACVTVTNTTPDTHQVDGVSSSWSDRPGPGGGSLYNGYGPTIAPGAQLTLPIDNGEGARPGNSGTISAYVYMTDNTLSKVATIGYEDLPAQNLTVTAGTDPTTACPAGGGQAQLTVTPGTTVYLCYVLTNTAAVDLVGTLTDANSADLGLDAATPITPGQSKSITTAGTVATSNFTASATWAASTNDPFTDWSGSTTASATITVQP
jgi:hypothetical protein